MAEHIQSIAASSIPKVLVEQFLAACRTGDMLFCSGSEPVSKGIEQFTGSCFSHVLMIVYSTDMREWLTVEATLQHGVHMGRLDYYLKRYPGDVVLTHRPVLSLEDIHAALHAGADVLDDLYNVGEEALMVCHRLLPWIRPRASTRDYFCSALMEHMSMATQYPLKSAGPGDPTPEENWLDPTVQPVCALVRNAATAG